MGLKVLGKYKSLQQTGPSSSQPDLSGSPQENVRSQPERLEDKGDIYISCFYLSKSPFANDGQEVKVSGLSAETRIKLKQMNSFGMTW